MQKVPENVPKNQAPGFQNRSFPWLIALLAALLLMINSMNASTFGVFFKPIVAEFEWSRGAMSGAYAVRSLLMAIFAIPMGYWSDRYGPRRVLVPCFLILGIGLLVYAKVATLWQMYLVQGILIGVVSSGPWVSLISTVAKWHDKKPGLALGIASAGIGLSSVIFPPIAAKLILIMGWGGAMAVLGLLTLAIGLPAAILIKDPPAPAKQQAIGNHRGPFEAWHMFPKFLNIRLFLVIILMFLFFYVACNMVTNHLVNYATDIGMSTLVAATLMSVMGIASTAGRLGMGTFSDRIGARTDMALSSLLVTVSLVLLSLKVPASMWVAVVLFGVGFGGAAPLIPALIGEQFSTKNLATMTGAVVVGANFGTAIGPWMGGIIFDVSNSYLWALILSAAFTTGSLAIAIWLPPATPETRDKVQSLFE